MLRCENKKFAPFAGRADTLLAVMVVVCEQHIATTRTHVTNLRKEGEYHVLDGLLHEFSYILLTGPTPPPDSSAAQLTIVCLTKEVIAKQYLRPYPLTEFFSCMIRQIEEQTFTVFCLVDLFPQRDSSSCWSFLYSCSHSDYLR